ncbi:MAG: hypothetical protein CVU00_07860 [Bacteroidetes bacterium HGW-Bacteroidetes-17]|nr:MAG: hypothetical protein CVU00_07860 [Bacteroidetes bacterium HGW-Bacteroidetes-17]
MNSQIEERIKIARSFKSVYDPQNKNLGKREKWLKLSAGFDYWVVMIMLIFLIFLSLAAILQIDPINTKWQKSGLIVLMTFAISIKSPYSFIELLLINHIKRLESLNLNFPEFLNQDFKEIIIKLNSKKTRFNLLQLPLLIIILGALLQTFNFNPFWNYFSFLVLAVSTILLIRINYQIRFVKKHLIKFDSIINHHYKKTHDIDEAILVEKKKGSI